MHPLQKAKDLDALIEAIGDRRIVMLGEASHGTHEFYTWRTAISKRLIEEKGFRFIAVEGDWPDCNGINSYIKGRGKETGIKEVLARFDRWPSWMWANWEVAALAEWLLEHNHTKAGDKPVGFYGLDVYSLWDSMREMVSYLEGKDGQAAKWARQAFRCFEPYMDNEQLYARRSLAGHSCREEVVALLREVRLRAQHLDGDHEAALNAEQNAHIAVNAERYYRSMMGFDNESWNIRDTHMMDTLNRLLEFHGPQSKAIVWEHNTHIGDARATDMKRAGMVNIGQLAREQYGINQVFLCGFSTYSGSVIAGEAWGAEMQEMEVPPARAESIEETLHHESAKDRYYLFHTGEEDERFAATTDHRAIGVVYLPEQERRGNYVPSLLAQRYDALIHIDRTKALHALGMPAKGKGMPDLYPFGL